MKTKETINIVTQDENICPVCEASIKPEYSNWIDMPYYSTTVISNIRPCIVLSNNQANKTSKTILVTPITRRLKRPELPCHVTLNDKSMVKLEVIIPVEKEKITGYYGKLTDKQLREVNQAMLIELGII